MSFLLIFYFILTLSILVFFHELGHYYAARYCSVKVLSFSIGFGKPIISKTDSNGTNWLLSSIPFGGYVKMLDDRNEEEFNDQKIYCFNHKSKIQRSFILLAGPLANFFLASFLYTIIAFVGIDGRVPLVGIIDSQSPANIYGLENGDIIYSVDGTSVETQYETTFKLAERIGDTGFISLDVQTNDHGVRNIKIPIMNWLGYEKNPNFYKSLGFSFFIPDSPIIIDEVFDNSPASIGGLKSGDKLLSINNQMLSNWAQLAEIIKKSPRKKLIIKYDREGVLNSSTIFVESNFIDSIEYGSIGVKAFPVQWPKDLMTYKKYSFFNAIYYGFNKTLDTIKYTCLSVYKLISGSISSSSLGGPLTIAKYATSSAQIGIIPYMSFLAILSVSLGVLNLMPIPMLDGGQLLIIIIEGVIGRPIPDNYLIYVQQVGLLIILSIMLLAIFNDFS